MKRVKARVRISRPLNCSEERDLVDITITDETSGVLIVEVSLGRLEFVDILTNREATGIAEVYDSHDKVGRYGIIKTVMIPGVEEDYNLSYALQLELRERYARDAVKEYCVDGWEYCSNQLGNLHYKKDKKYPVYLKKYVDTELEQEEWQKDAKNK